MGPAEIGAWAVSVVAGAGTAWRLLAPVIRDFKGKGDDPSLRTLVQLAADNSTLLVEDVGQVKGKVDATAAKVDAVKTQADRVEGALADLHERVDRVEEFTGIRKVKRA